MQHGPAQAFKEVPTLEQFAPRLSHRSHAYVNVNVAGNPAQVPFVVVSVSSLAAVPDRDGAAVFCGEPALGLFGFQLARSITTCTLTLRAWARIRAEAMLPLRTFHAETPFWHDGGPGP